MTSWQGGKPCLWQNVRKKACPSTHHCARAASPNAPLRRLCRRPPREPKRMMCACRRHALRGTCRGSGATAWFRSPPPGTHSEPAAQSSPTPPGGRERMAALRTNRFRLGTTDRRAHNGPRTRRSVWRGGPPSKSLHSSHRHDASCGPRLRGRPHKARNIPEKGGRRLVIRWSRHDMCLHVYDAAK